MSHFPESEAPLSPQEGVIRYTQHHTPGPAPVDPVLASLIRCRNRLFEAGLIGVYPDGIGYGNLSARTADGGFVISASQTGHVPVAEAAHFVQVTGWNFDAWELNCTGPLPASSESMTHAMLYALSPAIQVVLHVHHAGMWQQWQGMAPTTGAAVEYGTPEMAAEMRRLWDTGETQCIPFLVMAGHTDGILAWGPDVESALRILSIHFEPWGDLGNV